MDWPGGYVREVVGEVVEEAEEVEGPGGINAGEWVWLADACRLAL